ncbi:hypothetical protein FSARC_14678 [Fusarium sarcochroum]|uniref:CBM-cenC domain-containing protein n=1 Tax=Fusarium sarcochroum TaxID=1208366 RepID=A0A8H4SRK3_9HYPO|nr:hypothetical protein FSARC_14678 [Fusarium sarcochroum]
MKLLPRTILLLSGLLAPLAVADEVSCSEQASKNLLANPSWESGLPGWSYSYSGAGLSSEHTDGVQSVYTPGTVILGQIFQTVQDLQIGVEYSASVDYMPFMDPSTTLQKTCLAYLIHDEALTSNIISYKTMVVNRNTNSWNTLAGTYKPTKSTMVFRLISNCGTPATPLFRFYWDNAIFKGPPTEVCTTSLSPTSTTEATTTADPTTTSEGQSTTEALSTTSASETTTEAQTTTTSDQTSAPTDSMITTSETETSTFASETTIDGQTTTTTDQTTATTDSQTTALTDSTTTTIGSEISTFTSETTTGDQTTTTTDSQTSSGESQSTTKAQTSTSESETVIESQSTTSQTPSISEAPTTTPSSTTFATSTRTRHRCRP